MRPGLPTFALSVAALAAGLSCGRAQRPGAVPAAPTAPVSISPTLAPSTPSKTVRAALARPDYQWRLVPTPHFDLYVQAGSPSDVHRAAVAAAAERALAADLVLIGAPAYPNRIQLLFVTSRAQMGELAGRPVGGLALVEPDEGGDAALFVARSENGLGALRHELMHLVTVKLWGQPAEPSDWDWRGHGDVGGWHVRRLRL